MAFLPFSLSQRSVGPCRGGSRPDCAEPGTPAGQGVPRPQSPGPSVWRRLQALDQRINDSWVGDLLGIALLCLIVIAVPVALPILVIIFGGTP
ncbi:hypothetical protein [Gemmobacter denitrificans]|uniref:ABC transporter permease n=1 Tax=Gemmobacter denitrificans TaxID=3123040 RepID=A0ABU8C1P5_9RHOB